MASFIEGLRSYIFRTGKKTEDSSKTIAKDPRYQEKIFRDAEFLYNQGKKTESANLLRSIGKDDITIGNHFKWWDDNFKRRTPEEKEKIMNWQPKYNTRDELLNARAELNRKVYFLEALFKNLVEDASLLGVGPRKNAEVYRQLIADVAYKVNNTYDMEGCEKKIMQIKESIIRDQEKIEKAMLANIDKAEKDGKRLPASYRAKRVFGNAVKSFGEGNVAVDTIDLAKSGANYVAQSRPVQAISSAINQARTDACPTCGTALVLDPNGTGFMVCQKCNQLYSYSNAGKLVRYAQRGTVGIASNAVSGIKKETYYKVQPEDQRLPKAVAWGKREIDAKLRKEDNAIKRGLEDIKKKMSGASDVDKKNEQMRKLVKAKEESEEKLDEILGLEERAGTGSNNAVKFEKYEDEANIIKFRISELNDRISKLGEEIDRDKNVLYNEVGRYMESLRKNGVSEKVADEVAGKAEEKFSITRPDLRQELRNSLRAFADQEMVHMLNNDMKTIYNGIFNRASNRVNNFYDWWSKSVMGEFVVSPVLTGGIIVYALSWIMLLNETGDFVLDATLLLAFGIIVLITLLVGMGKG